MYTQANLTVGLERRRAGRDAADAPVGAGDPAGRPGKRRAPPCRARGRRDSRSRSSRRTPARRRSRSGLPIEVTRSHPDFAALSVARAWLGEHRIASGRLYQRIREVRGMNYGDYAYIEAFPRGMFQFFPDPNIVRQRQIFEIWIRPVVPVNAHMALRIAIHELDGLIQNGLSAEEFETTRDYLMNNVYVMTARQDQQLGYALDSQWYGTGEFTDTLRKQLQALTARAGQRGDQAAPERARPFGRLHHQGRGGTEAGARDGRVFADQVRRGKAARFAGGRQGDRSDEAEYRRRQGPDYAGR